MSDDVARAVGAGTGTPVTIGGRECFARPLTIKELAEAERICLDDYRKSYIKTWADSLEHLPEDMRETMLEKHVEKAARWTVLDLPSVDAYVGDRVKLTDDVRAWLLATFNLNGKPQTTKKKQSKAEREKAQLAYELQLRNTVSSALDDKMLSPDEYKKMTGEAAPVIKIGYPNWWISSTIEGRITMVWLCFRADGVSRDDVASEMQSNPTLVSEFARQIELLSVPSVGNG